MTNDEKKALISNATDLAQEKLGLLRPRHGSGYSGPPTTNQGPRRRGQPMW